MEKINWTRKVLSLFILLFALLYYFTSKKIILITLIAMLSIFLFFNLLNYYSKGKSKIANIFFKLYPKKEHEYKRPITDATIFFISTIFLILIFKMEIVIMSLILLTFVDANEQIFGIKFSKSKKLFWNKDKNYAGTLAGFLTGIIISLISILTLKLGFGIWTILPISIISSLAGTAKKFDNIIMPWATSVTLYLLTLF